MPTDHHEKEFVKRLLLWERKEQHY